MTERSPGEARLEDLVRGARIGGIPGVSEATIESVTWYGTQAIDVVYRDGSGGTGSQVLYRDMEPALRVLGSSSAGTFDADPGEFKLAAEALRIRMAGRFDPMLAVTTSLVEPLPHQLRAVYGDLLARTPLRFLLADDPGAGKTIMAGLFIKELLLRGDLARCLIVAPGSLVEQWQGELSEKFGLRFEILSRALIQSCLSGRVFAEHPLLIARMDQLCRSAELTAQLEDTDWDLVVVDEAHRMSAHTSGGELKTTKRYQLGLLLGRVARHFLLMTATPHAGKDEDFQLFMALLDADRFEGRFRAGVHAMNVDGLMRRMVKEDLLTFEGRHLFPQRFAKTVPYELSDGETQLYEAVTQYVREEMNRAEKLKQSGDGRRFNTVGFALTVLQRRLASSPEAIWRSLERRRHRLERRRAEAADLSYRPDMTRSPRLDDVLESAEDPTKLDDALEDLDGAELEELEEDVMDAATAARTIAELNIEIAILADLEALARAVRFSGTDRKWNELRALLLDDELTHDGSGNLRKIIIFTEHRDTLNYLTDQIRGLLGRPDAVVEIHGGMPRHARRRVQEAFTQDKAVQVLVATDAAGEGLNLQRAHLMVNYDLPWNPNRIEQRFGRIHRIGQTEVCHLWNLVAANTREGAVYQRLLEKVEAQRNALDSDRVFDVLGEAFTETPLRDLLMQAIRYGERPEVRAELDRVIDASVGEGIERLLAERALAYDTMTPVDVDQIRVTMEAARARRLQPHYIQAFFLAAFTRLGGRIRRAEQARFEITHVPAPLRARMPDRMRARARDSISDLTHPLGVAAPVLARYERVTFQREAINHPGAPVAELIAPGHPLLDAVVDLTIERHGTALKQGTVLVDPNAAGPRLLFAVAQEITDGNRPPRTVSKKFDYVEITPEGAAHGTGPAPYLDYESLPEQQRSRAEATIAGPWLAGGAQRIATNWAVTEGAPEHRREVAGRVREQVAKTREQVRLRLNAEINYWGTHSVELAENVALGRKVKISPETAISRARNLEARLESRLAQLDRDEALVVCPPRITGIALIIPATEHPEVAAHARQTEQVERRAVAAVLSAERALGRTPIEMARNNPGFDILSSTPGEPTITIEVKGRIAGADEVTFTRTEVMTGKNLVPNHRIGLVIVDPDDPSGDRLRYLVNYFADEPDPAFDTTRVVKSLAQLWDAGGEPI